MRRTATAALLLALIAVAGCELPTAEEEQMATLKPTVVNDYAETIFEIEYSTDGWESVESTEEARVPGYSGHSFPDIELASGTDVRMRLLATTLGETYTFEITEPIEVRETTDLTMTFTYSYAEAQFRMTWQTYRY
jgi:hypothetical protein